MYDRLLIVDVNSIASRSFYVGEPALFFKMTDDVIRALEVDGSVYVFDDPWQKSFREEIFPQYKAHRRNDPEKNAWIGRLRESCVAAGLCCTMSPEADDVIATIAASSDVPALKKYIFSGDKDFFALIREGVLLVGFEKMDGMYRKVVYELDDVRGRFGTTPEQVRDYKALAGDRSDGIPGCPGIGDKWARKLLEEYGDIDSIYYHLVQDSEEQIRLVMPDHVERKLRDGEKITLLSRDLATMRLDTPLIIDWAEALEDPRKRSSWATLTFGNIKVPVN